MSVIECITLDGQNKMVPKDNLVLRPAVYAVIVQGSKVLLMTVHYTGKYHLPGGGIEAGDVGRSRYQSGYREICLL